MHVCITGEPEGRDGLTAILRTFPGVVAFQPQPTGAEPPCVPPDTDLVLLDSEEGDSSTPRALRRLRATPGTPPVAVIAPAWPQTFLADCLSAGAAGVLHHGMEQTLLLSALRILASGGSVFFPHAAPPAVSAAGAGPEEHAESALENLTARQREVLELLAAGLTNTEIAERLGISRDTVKEHVRAIFRRLGVRHRVAAAGLIHQTGC